MKNILKNYYKLGKLDKDTYLLCTHLRAYADKVEEAEPMLKWLLQRRGLNKNYEYEWHEYLRRRKNEKIK